MTEEYTGCIKEGRHTRRPSSKYVFVMRVFYLLVIPASVPLTCSITSSHTFGFVCLNRRMVGYHGESERLVNQR